MTRTAGVTAPQAGSAPDSGRSRFTPTYEHEHADDDQDDAGVHEQQRSIVAMLSGTRLSHELSWRSEHRKRVVGPGLRIKWTCAVDDR